jgi:ferredoxin
MIVGDQKPVDEILAMLEGAGNVLVLGCGTCVTVCLSGGEREADTLAGILRMSGKHKSVTSATIERQCDAEFFDDVKEKIDSADAVLSLACGAGVQMAASIFGNKPVYPGLNTKFMGVAEEAGRWTENCLGCGDCKLGKTGGVCPVTRCSKSLLNGPCGGSANGMCEVNPDEIECGWQMIYDRLEKLGQLDKLTEIEPANDWSKAHDGGPRTVRREDVLI